MPADVPTTGPNLRSPDERPPVEPIAATQHTAAGAKAFAEFFIKTIDWGYATISGAYVRHYAARDCVTCRSVMTNLEADRRAGHRYSGGRSTVTGAAPGAQGALATQVVAVNATAFEELTRTGKYVTADPAYHDQRFEVGLQWTKSTWQVLSLNVIQ